MGDRWTLDKKREFAPSPEPLRVKCVDVHAHLEICTNTAPDSPEIEALLDEAARVGIDRVVQVGISVEQSKWCVQMADAFPGRVLAAVAIHPNDAPDIEDLDGALAEIDALASHPRVRAIGETGLDFFRTEPELQAKQKYSFVKHIEIAKKHDLALVIHDRDAHRAVLDTLLQVGAPKTTIFHCYSGDEAMARECVAAGYILSFSGTVTFKNAPALRDAVKIVPPHLLLVETDSPFLSPTPHRGMLNTPAQIPNIIRFIADVRGDDVDELTQILSDNAERYFGAFN